MSHLRTDTARSVKQHHGPRRSSHGGTLAYLCTPWTVLIHLKTQTYPISTFGTVSHVYFPKRSPLTRVPWRLGPWRLLQAPSSFPPTETENVELLLCGRRFQVCNSKVQWVRAQVVLSTLVLWSRVHLEVQSLNNYMLMHKGQVAASSFYPIGCLKSSKALDLHYGSLLQHVPCTMWSLVPWIWWFSAISDPIHQFCDLYWLYSGCFGLEIWCMRLSYGYKWCYADWWLLWSSFETRGSYDVMIAQYGSYLWV